MDGWMHGWMDAWMHGLKSSFTDCLCLQQSKIVVVHYLYEVRPNFVVSLRYTVGSE